MAIRITTYKDAFKLIGVMPSGKINDVIKKLERDGHTEKSISFSIWKSKDKLRAFSQDKRFCNILINEVRKWSWARNDPRWDAYWKKKNEEKRAEIMERNLKLKQESAIKNNIAVIKGNGNVVMSYVYFIQGENGGAIKIGTTTDLANRLKTLQTGYPDTLRCLLLLRGNTKLESQLHEEFKAYRLSGEWFKPAKAIFDKINSFKKGAK